MTTFYDKYAQLEVLASGTAVAHAASTATLFASGSATAASLYFFKGDGTQVDLAASQSDLTVDGDSGTGDIALSSQELTIAGATGLDTAMSSQTLTITPDFNEFSAITPVTTDQLVCVDATDNSTAKMTVDNLANLFAGTVTSTGLSDSAAVLTWDLQNWTASTTIVDADLIGVDDGANGTLRKMTRGNLLGSATAAFSNGMTATTGDFSGNVTMDGNVTLGDAQGDVVTSTGQLTASAGILLADDTKLYFGTNADAQMYYDEASDNALVLSGAAGGFFINVADDSTEGFAIIQGDNDYLAVVTTDSSERVKLSVDTTIIDDTKLYFGTGEDVSLEYDEDGTDSLFITGSDITIADDTKLYFGNNQDASIEYDEDGDNALILSGAAGGVYFNVADDSSEAFSILQNDNDYLSVVTTDSSERIKLSVDTTIIDDTKLYFGTGEDVSLEYDEDGTDSLLISGGDVTIADDKKLYFGTNQDASIEYDEDSDDVLIIDGSIRVSVTDNTGEAFAIMEGSNDYLTVVTTNGSEEIQLHKDTTVMDDKKLYFGTDQDASIEYDEDSDNVLIIDGSIRLSITDNDSEAFSVMEGSNDYIVCNTSNSGERIILSQSVRIPDDTELYFGSDDDWYIEYDEDGDNILVMSGSGLDMHLTDGLEIKFQDNDSNVFTLKQNDDQTYMNIDTTNSSEMISFGENTAGVDVTFYGANSNDIMLWEAGDNALIIKDGGTETVRIGGDATTDYAVDVGNGSAGSNNINKIRASAFVTFSDERMKSNFSAINNATDTVNRINPVNFTWKSDGSKDFGFVAQDLQKVVPQAVHGDADSGYGVDYGRLTSILVKALQEQSAEIALLKQKIEDI